jgi:hypothetical protein
MDREVGMKGILRASSAMIASTTPGGRGFLTRGRLDILMMELLNSISGDRLMEKVTGTIGQAGKTILREIPISIEESPSSERAKGWQGDFVVPVGEITPEVGGLYELELSDGRSCDIFIESAKIGSRHQPGIHFLTTGKFT